MKQQRPVFLDLTKIRFPVTAIASILHRISGFIIFLLIPLLLWLAHTASSSAGFAYLQADLGNVVLKFFLWVIVAALLFHLLAGLRHLLMDMHIGETLESAKVMAWTTIIVSIVLIILAGVWLW